MEVVKACLRIIWECRLHCNLKFWAMENPVGFLRQFMGIPHYTFKQWEFGETTVKRTDIWGYFKNPTPTVKQPPEQVTTHFGKIGHALQWSKPKAPEEYAEYLSQFNSGEKRAAVRAITPRGFAEAFYRANK